LNLNYNNNQYSRKMNKITSGLLLALGAANAMSFEELNGLRAKLASAHSNTKPTVQSIVEPTLHHLADPTVKSCGQAHCSEIGAVLTDTCKLNKWEEGKVVMLYHIEPKEVCYCNCPKTLDQNVRIGSFISEEQAKALERDTNAFRPLADEASKAWAQGILDHYKAFFPAVTFHLVWENNAVNAVAYVRNGQRHVEIWGGLVRHKSLGPEAVALITGHELGHHYSGKPGGSLCCEGQADYGGTRDLMRKAWFGEQYVNTVKKGIAQVAGFFNVADDPNIPDGPGGCSHPPGKCRVATYYTALTLENPKPKCAGPNE
jgi:hypothetical protein